ncbi:MAG: hypothetical protein KAS77_09345, partial [Thermoplasmata archaeon]|nr:hypothetical protein [Thermoplasmata archaeon]
MDPGHAGDPIGHRCRHLNHPPLGAQEAQLTDRGRPLPVEARVQEQSHPDAPGRRVKQCIHQGGHLLAPFDLETCQLEMDGLRGDADEVRERREVGAP